MIYNCFCNPTTGERLLTQRVSIKDLISTRVPEARNKAAFIWQRLIAAGSFGKALGSDAADGWFIVQSDKPISPASVNERASSEP